MKRQLSSIVLALILLFTTSYPVWSVSYVSETHPISVTAGTTTKFDKDGMEQEKIVTPTKINNETVFGYYQTLPDGRMVIIQCDPTTNAPTGYAYYYEDGKNQVGTELVATNKSEKEEFCQWEDPVPIYSPTVKIWMPGNGIEWLPNVSTYMPRGGVYIPGSNFSDRAVVASVNNPNPFAIKASLEVNGKISFTDTNIELAANSTKDFIITSDPSNLNIRLTNMGWCSGSVQVDPGYSQLNYLCKLKAIEYPDNYPKKLLGTGGFFQNKELPPQYRDTIVITQKKLRWITAGTYPVIPETRLQSRVPIQTTILDRRTGLYESGEAMLSTPVHKIDGQYTASYNFAINKWELISNQPLIPTVINVDYIWHDLIRRDTKFDAIYESGFNNATPETKAKAWDTFANQVRQWYLGQLITGGFISAGTVWDSSLHAKVQENADKKVLSILQNQKPTDMSRPVCPVSTTWEKNTDWVEYFEFLQTAEKNPLTGVVFASWLYTPDWCKAYVQAQVVAPTINVSKTGGLDPSIRGQFGVFPLSDVTFKLIGHIAYDDIELIGVPKIMDTVYKVKDIGGGEVKITPDSRIKTAVYIY